MDKKHLPEVIVGDRLTLKKHDLALAELMFKYVDQDRQRLRQFLPWVDATNRAQDEIDFIKMTHEKWDEYFLYDFGMYRNSDGVYMGNIGVHTISWGNERCELGYWVLGDFEGQGYMSEAVSVLESALFKLGILRIEIRCSSLNQRSANVPKRCGYTFEGTLRQNMKVNGEFHDTYVFSKLRNESK